MNRARQNPNGRGRPPLRDTPIRRFRRWRFRLYRRRPWSRRALIICGTALCLAILLVTGMSLAFSALRDDTRRVPEVEIAAPPAATPGPEETETPVPIETPDPAQDAAPPQ